MSRRRPWSSVLQVLTCGEVSRLGRLQPDGCPGRMGGVWGARSAASPLSRSSRSSTADLRSYLSPRATVAFDGNEDACFSGTSAASFSACPSRYCAIAGARSEVRRSGPGHFGDCGRGAPPSSTHPPLRSRSAYWQPCGLRRSPSASRWADRPRSEATLRPTPAAPRLRGPHACSGRRRCESACRLGFDTPRRFGSSSPRRWQSRGRSVE
jgi:hypothetical protein